MIVFFVIATKRYLNISPANSKVKVYLSIAPTGSYDRYNYISYWLIET